MSTMTGDIALKICDNRSIRVYLAGPGNQLQADKASGQPVLFSFAYYADYLDKYQQTFPHILIDSGAFSEMNTGVQIDGYKYKDWAERWAGRADAIAGLDDISGDWRRSLRNYKQFGGFPTMHDTDPPELLDDLISIAREQGGGWIGIGLKPPRQGKEQFIQTICDQIPDDLHIHGWALRAYTHINRLDSVDSTNWFREALDIRNNYLCKHLSYAECLEIIVKRYERAGRNIKAIEKKAEPAELSLFDSLQN